jgi:hypothetical protein
MRFAVGVQVRQPAPRRTPGAPNPTDVPVVLAPGGDAAPIAEARHGFAARA